MQSCTAIIDIGSNSARLVIYEKSTTHDFHLICEEKSKVRIGEGAYEKGGYLQPKAIKRAYIAIKAFISTAQHYPIEKILCVATSALRDAPNGLEFTSWIKNQLDLDIEIIGGQREAYLGAIATKKNLAIKEGITIDIGGGSSDLSLLKNSEIIATHSLNIGTVRLKELFFDKNRPLNETRSFVKEELERLPKIFKHELVIGIGGTARTLSKAIIKMQNHPLAKLQGFKYNVNEQEEYFQSIVESKPKILKELQIPKGHFDTIREGTLIWKEILNHVNAKKIITSTVGIREGVFLDNLLRDNKESRRNSS